MEPRTAEAAKTAAERERLQRGVSTGEWPSECDAELQTDKTMHLCGREDNHEGNHWCAACEHEWSSAC